jgi:hypothetical protein
MKRSLLFITLSIFLFSCSRNRVIEDVQRYQIRSVAVLPVEFEFTGRMPDKVDSSKWRQALDQQAGFIQQSMYANLTNYYHRRRRSESQVQFQSADRTLSLLTEKGIAETAAAKMDPKELSKILGVDAVLSLKVTQNRIMSDEASLGIQVLGNVMNNNLPGANIPTWVAHSGDLYISCALVKEGFSVWSNQFRRQTDWHRPVQEAIQNATRTIALRFPL